MVDCETISDMMSDEELWGERYGGEGFEPLEFFKWFEGRFGGRSI